MPKFTHTSSKNAYFGNLLESPGVLNTITLHDFCSKSPLERRFRASQIVIITNFVILLSVECPYKEG